MPPAPQARRADGPDEPDTTDAIGFTTFHLDLVGGRLLQGAKAIALRRKTWEVLRYLADRPGVLVTKEELLDQLWPDVAVTPGTLSKSIGELRVALDDDCRAPQVIETVHRRGFRFIAATRRVATAELAPPGAAAVGDGSRASQATRPFVGRDDELRRLSEALTRARAGERQVVFVTGPAGVGKTALVDAFLGSPALRGAAPVSVARADCSERHGAQETYAPMFDAVAQLARRQPAEPLVQLMRRTAPLWLAQMPWLLDEAGMNALRHALQGVRPERMPRELAALVEALAADRTLVVVIEDLHWSDPATVDLLAMLAQRREPARLLIIGTYRPAEVAVAEHPLGQVVALLRARRQCGELALQDIDEAAVANYLARRFPGHEFPPVLARLIHHHTGGQPLFLVAIVDHLLSRGWILDTAPGWQLSMPPERLDLGVPDDVRRMIETQLHALPPAARAVLEAASVTGDAVTSRIVAAALRCKTGSASRQCEALAHRLQFLRTAGTIEWPDGSVSRRYVFTHDLYRQVVYEETPEEHRAILHRRIGVALERAHGAEAARIAPDLLVHFERGRDPERAAHHLIAAAAQARGRFASREAIGHLERALDLTAQLPDGEGRDRREAEARLLLGRALSDTVGFAAEPVRENYERVSALCAAAGDVGGSFEALYARWYVHALRAEREPTLAVAAELAEVAARLATPVCGQLADSVLVRTAFFDGDFAAVPRHMGSMLAHPLERSADRFQIAYGVDPLVAALVFHGAASWFLGDTEGARLSNRASVARARASGNPLFLSAALAQAALVELLGRDSEVGGALAEEAVALTAAEGFAMWHGLAAAMSAVARIQRGEAVAGARALDEALAAMHATGTTCISACLYAHQAEGHWRAGALTQGLAAVQAGLALTATSLQCGYEPELWRLKGEILLAPRQPPRRSGGRKAAPLPDPQWKEAEHCLLRAVETSRAAAAKSLELRAATSLARAWAERHRVDEARTGLGAICDHFDAALTTPDLSAARALLARLAGPSR